MAGVRGVMVCIPRIERIFQVKEMVKKPASNLMATDADLCDLVSESRIMSQNSDSEGPQLNQFKHETNF